MSGFVLTDEDIQRVGTKYKCCRCHLILRAALQLACGHHVCASCFVEWKNESDQMTEEVEWDVVPSLTCPIDHSRILSEEVYPDRFVQREVSCLMVHCLQHSYGCDWRGELKELEKHCQSCVFAVVECECGMTLRRSDLGTHEQDECPARLQRCSYCEEQVKLNEMEGHLDNDCPSFPTACTLCGQPGIIRSKLEEHWDPDLGKCEKVTHFCKFWKYGCKMTGPMKLEEFLRHREAYRDRHLDMLANAGFATQKDVAELRDASRRNDASTGEELTQIRAAVGQLQRQQQQQRQREAWSVSPGCTTLLSGRNELNMNDIVAAIEHLDGKVNAQEEREERRSASCADTDRMVAVLHQTQAHSARQSAQALETTRQLEEKVDRLSGLLGAEQQGAARDGVLLWKIADFQSRRNEAVQGRQPSLYSRCFYTSRRGYKLCARIHLDGDGSGKGTHISVFFVVMRGEFDHKLRWPFRQKVTIMLLDQDNVEHVTSAFRPDPNSASFQRPREEMNVASGCPLFCPLSELGKRAYVKNDAICIKIIVDKSDGAQAD